MYPIFFHLVSTKTAATPTGAHTSSMAPWDRSPSVPMVGYIMEYLMSKMVENCGEYTNVLSITVSMVV